jgi:hypothetical protein
MTKWYQYKFAHTIHSLSLNPYSSIVTRLLKKVTPRLPRRLTTTRNIPRRLTTTSEIQPMTMTITTASKAMKATRTTMKFLPHLMMNVH